MFNKFEVNMSDRRETMLIHANKNPFLSDQHIEADKRGPH